MKDSEDQRPLIPGKAVRPVSPTDRWETERQERMVRGGVRERREDQKKPKKGNTCVLQLLSASRMPDSKCQGSVDRGTSWDS